MLSANRKSSPSSPEALVFRKSQRATPAAAIKKSQHSTTFSDYLRDYGAFLFAGARLLGPAACIGSDAPRDMYLCCVRPFCALASLPCVLLVFSVCWVCVVGVGWRVLSIVVCGNKCTDCKISIKLDMFEKIICIFYWILNKLINSYFYIVPTNYLVIVNKKQLVLTKKLISRDYWSQMIYGKFYIIPYI